MTRLVRVHARLRWPILSPIVVRRLVVRWVLRLSIEASRLLLLVVLVQLVMAARHVELGRFSGETSRRVEAARFAVRGMDCDQLGRLLRALECLRRRLLLNLLLGLLALRCVGPGRALLAFAASNDARIDAASLLESV